MAYKFLDKYKIEYQKVEESEARRLGRLKHCFFAVPDLYIQKATFAINPFPVELLKFYEEIGFGFFHRTKDIGHILLDPRSLVCTNMQVGYFATEQVKEYIQLYDISQKLLFFQTFKEQYFAISRIAENGKNAIWYKEQKIEESLFDFLLHCSRDRNYLSLQIKRYERKSQHRFQTPNSHARRTE